MIKSQGQNRWNELRQTIKDAVQAFNNEIEGHALSWETIQSNRISITRAEGELKLEGGFDSDAAQAFFRCPQAKIDIRLHLEVIGGKVEFMSHGANGVSHINRPEDVAYGLMRDLLRG